MTYLLSFDVPDDGHTIECPTLAAVRAELVGDYFRAGKELAEAMKVLTTEGVWRGEGEVIKLFVQCGTRGVNPSDEPSNNGGAQC